MDFRIPMVDLQGQYQRLKPDIDHAIEQVLQRGDFINGQEVALFAQELAQSIGSKHVIPCANGTDALQIALMALPLQRGDEVIVPSFTYVASAEVIALLGLTPVWIDVDANTFNLDPSAIEKAITPRTKAIIPVHLFGQSAPMEEILAIAHHYNLFVIEDNAQALGAVHTFSNGNKAYTGTMGTVGCTSFFPSKNLGCYGDGGAVFCQDDALAERLRMIANHGQRQKYHHEIVGCNSRLDTLQAAILRCKLPHLSHYNAHRRQAALYYTKHLQDIKGIIVPQEVPYSSHVYHQYTLQIAEKRDALKRHLAEKGIPSMVYYPIPLHEQKAFNPSHNKGKSLPQATRLAQEVLSLPIDSEITTDTQDTIIAAIRQFFT